MTDETPTPPAPNHHQKWIALLILGLLFIGGGWMIWRQGQLQGAKRDRAYVQQAVEKSGLHITYTPMQQGKTLIWKDVTLTVPKGVESQIPYAKIDEIRFEEGKKIVVQRLRVPLAGGEKEAGMVGVKTLTIDNPVYQDGIIRDYTTTLTGVLAEGDKPKTWRTQLTTIAPLFLRGMPKEVRTLPRTFLNALDNAVIESRGRYLADSKQYTSSTTVKLNDFLTLSLDGTLDNITPHTVKTLLKPLPSTDPHARLLEMVEKLSAGNYVLRLTNAGVVEKGLALYAGVSKQDVSTVKEKALTALTTIPEAHQKKITPAVTKVLTGEAKTVVVHLQPTDIGRTLLKRMNNDLRPQLKDYEGDREGFKEAVKNWWLAQPETIDADWEQFVKMKINTE